MLLLVLILILLEHFVINIVNEANFKKNRANCGHSNCAEHKRHMKHHGFFRSLRFSAVVFWRIAGKTHAENNNGVVRKTNANHSRPITERQTRKKTES